MGTSAIATAVSSFATYYAAGKLAAYGIVSGPWYFVGVGVVGIGSFIASSYIVKWATPLGKLSDQ
jgi:hypothetical protein